MSVGTYIYIYEDRSSLKIRPGMVHIAGMKPPILVDAATTLSISVNITPIISYLVGLVGSLI